MIDHLIVLTHPLDGPVASTPRVCAERLWRALPVPHDSGAEALCAMLGRSLYPRDTVPFRAPHHTTSKLGLVGDDRHPGELTLAHGGMLAILQAEEWPSGVMRCLAASLRDPGTHARHVWPMRPSVVLLSWLACWCGRVPCQCGEAARESFREHKERIMRLFDGAAARTSEVDD